VISCCWFLRREVVERVGPLDEHIFYAPEDVDYCLRVWRQGLAVAYFPFFRVLHHTRQVTHKRPVSPTALSHLKGLFYYWRKHRYLFSRGLLEDKWMKPLASRLDPLLGAWEAPS
jgi:GT2 family glycosyltransferase